MVKFCIVGVRRTGTTLIRTTLDSHPRIRCYGASFRHGERLTNTEGENYQTGYQHHLSESLLRKLRDKVAPEAMVYQYLDDLFSAKEYDAVGFKLLDYEFRQYPAVIKYLREHKVRMIQVIRKNVLKTLISRSVKKVRRFGRSTSEVARTQIELRKDRIVHDLERIDMANKQWVKECTGLPFMTVTYEEFVADKDAELRRMLEFLAVEYVQDLKSPLIKVNPDDIRQIITNYDAIEEKLKGTPFEWCLTA